LTAHPDPVASRRGFFTLISGTRNNGTYEAKMRLPQGSAQGTWSPDIKDLSDQVGNLKVAFKQDLTNASLPTGFTNQ
jgi:hypothetical protein